MMDEPQIEVSRVLPQGGPGTLTPEEANAILEVAYLATAADRKLLDEELGAFRELAAAMAALTGGNEPPGHHDVDAMLERFAVALDHTEIADRLRAVAAVLGGPVARDTAYKVAFAMALCDLAESDDEEDFDDELVAALGLSEDRADELAAQVYEAIGGDDEPDGADEG